MIRAIKEHWLSFKIWLRYAKCLGKYHLRINRGIYLVALNNIRALHLSTRLAPVTDEWDISPPAIRRFYVGRYAITFEATIWGRKTEVLIPLEDIVEIGEDK